MSKTENATEATREPPAVPAVGSQVDLVLGLVERLRTRPTGDPYLHMMVHEAADEIERLQWDLGELRGRIAQMEHDKSKAVAAERERCAKLCEERFSDGALVIADAIRALGKA
jgi:hypothetical protein